MEQKFSPSSKVGSIDDIAEFKKCSKNAFAKRNQKEEKRFAIEKDIAFWENQTSVYTVQNVLAVQNKYKHKAHTMSAHRSKKGKMLAVIIAVVAYVSLFTLTLVKADNTGMIIFFAILLGLTVGVFLYCAFKIIPNNIENSCLKLLKNQEEYRKDIDKAVIEDNKLSIIEQKAAADKVRELKEELKKLDSQHEESPYTALIEGWESTIAKAKFETILIGFGEGMSEGKIFNELLSYVPLNAKTYEEAMQVAFNRFRNNLIEGKASLDRCNNILNNMKK